jgi:hypothetical protein
VYVDPTVLVAGWWYIAYYRIQNCHDISSRHQNRVVRCRQTFWNQWPTSTSNHVIFLKVYKYECFKHATGVKWKKVRVLQVPGVSSNQNFKFLTYRASKPINQSIHQLMMTVFSLLRRVRSKSCHDWIADYVSRQFERNSYEVSVIQIFNLVSSIFKIAYSQTYSCLLVLGIYDTTSTYMFKNLSHMYQVVNHLKLNPFFLNDIFNIALLNYI